MRPDVLDNYIITPHLGAASIVSAAVIAPIQNFNAKQGSEGENMKNDGSETEIDRCVLEREKVFGVTSAFVMYYPGYRSASRLCDYNLTFYDPVVCNLPIQHEKNKETRGYREMERSRGKFVPHIAGGALENELIVLAGAAMSASDVVHTLRHFANEIEKHGLWIGKYEGDYVVENMNRTLTSGLLDEE